MYVRGSEWRRWDVHVHTPGTVHNNGFGDWEEYLCAIEAHPDVKAIGVTDYLMISNYSKVKGDHRCQRGQRGPASRVGWWSISGGHVHGRDGEPRRSCSERL